MFQIAAANAEGVLESMVNSSVNGASSGDGLVIQNKEIVVKF